MTLQWPHAIALGSGALFAIALSACGVFTDPDERSEPAIVIFSVRDTSVIIAPDTVARGESFEVRFRTYGGGCIYRIDRTDVRVSVNVAELRPYNVRTTSPVCTSDLRYFEHRATVRLPQSGPAAIVLIGDQRIGSATVPAVLQRRVIVR